MSSGDDPFGRSDRTIIRPNPAGRRTPTPSPGDPAAGAPSGGAAPASTPTPPVAYPTPQAGPPNAPSSSQGQRGWDDWMTPRAPNNLYVAPEAQAPMTPAPMSPHVSVDLVTVATSPLMRAAASLLVMLGRLRASLVRAGASQLMDQVAQAIEQFEIDARAAGVPNDQIETAKYTLAATADDIVQNLPTADSRTWTQYSMLVRFFNERMGGVRFFKELERAKQNPAVNLGVLEVMYACLSLGF
jgi:type VI secretion system protein ImpK